MVLHRYVSWPSCASRQSISADMLQQEHVLRPEQWRPGSMVLELHHRACRRSLPGSNVRRDGIHSTHSRCPVLLDMELLSSQLQAFPYLDARLDDLDRLVHISAGYVLSCTDWLILVLFLRLCSPSCELPQRKHARPRGHDSAHTS